MWVDVMQVFLQIHQSAQVRHCMLPRTGGMTYQAILGSVLDTVHSEPYLSQGHTAMWSTHSSLISQASTLPDAAAGIPWVQSAMYQSG